MVSTSASRFRAIRRRAVSITFAFGCMVLPVGCGEPAVQQSTMPDAEFAEKLEKEHPELFIRKIGKNKTEKIDGRDRRAIIREAQRKALQQGAG